MTAGADDTQVVHLSDNPLHCHRKRVEFVLRLLVDHMTDKLIIQEGQTNPRMG